jgi:hypothetical protein
MNFSCMPAMKPKQQLRQARFNPLKRILLVSLAGLFFAAIAGAQSIANAQAPVAAASQAVAIPAGTVANAVLVGMLDSKRLKAGDSVAARLTEAVISNGAVLLPKNTRLIGHLTQASARSKGEPDSSLAFQFDKAVLQSGVEIPLVAVLQALAPPMEISLAQSVGPAAPPASSGTGPVVTRTPTITAAGGTINTQVNAAVNSANQAAATSENAVNTVAKDPASRAASSPPAGGNIPAPGQLAHNTRGIVQMRGLTLTEVDSSSASPSVVAPLIHSDGPLVRLDTGTRLLLVIHPGAAASPPPKP